MCHINALLWRCVCIKHSIELDDFLTSIILTRCLLSHKIMFISGYLVLIWLMILHILLNTSTLLLSTRSLTPVLIRTRWRVRISVCLIRLLSTKALTPVLIRTRWRVRISVCLIRLLSTKALTPVLIRTRWRVRISVCLIRLLSTKALTPVLIRTRWRVRISVCLIRLSTSLRFEQRFLSDLLTVHNFR